MDVGLLTMRRSVTNPRSGGRQDITLVPSVPLDERQPHRRIRRVHLLSNQPAGDAIACVARWITLHVIRLGVDD